MKNAEIEELVTSQRAYIALLQDYIATLERKIAAMPPVPERDTDGPMGDPAESSAAQERMLIDALHSGDTESYVRLGTLLQQTPGLLQIESFGPADPVKPDSLRARRNAKAIIAQARLNWENEQMRPGGERHYPDYLQDGADVSKIPAQYLAGIDWSAIEADGDEDKSLDRTLYEADCANHGTTPKPPAAPGRIVMVPPDGKVHDIGSRE